MGKAECLWDRKDTTRMAPMILLTLLIAAGVVIGLRNYDVPVIRINGCPWEDWPVTRKMRTVVILPFQPVNRGLFRLLLNFRHSILSQTTGAKNGRPE